MLYSLVVYASVALYAVAVPVDDNSNRVRYNVSGRALEVGVGMRARQFGLEDCPAGYAECLSDGGCVPEGSICCGDGTFCRAGRLCSPLFRCCIEGEEDCEDGYGKPPSGGSSPGGPRPSNIISIADPYPFTSTTGSYVNPFLNPTQTSSIAYPYPLSATGITQGATSSQGGRMATARFSGNGNAQNNSNIGAGTDGGQGVANIRTASNSTATATATGPSGSITIGNPNSGNNSQSRANMTSTAGNSIEETSAASLRNTNNDNDALAANRPALVVLCFVIAVTSVL